MRARVKYPDWVEKYRQAGTNITKDQKGRYYLYKCHCEYDKVKKRGRKITDAYLGKITEEGLIPPRNKEITVKEYGASSFVDKIGQDIYENLKKHFGAQAEKIYNMAILRVTDRVPFKGMQEAYNDKYISEKYGKQGLSGANISEMLKEAGKDRGRIVKFLREYIKDEEYILFDGTKIVSDSQRMEINKEGYYKEGKYETQINLMMGFNASKKSPSYYRILPGNVVDVKAFKQTIEESEIKNVTIIADKGFGSKENIEMLEENGLKYIIPLRRNNKMIERDRLKKSGKENFDGYFLYKKRVIWYYEYKADNKNMVMYLDSDLKNEEEKDYISRIEAKNEGYSKENFIEKQYEFGTIAICNNIQDSAENIYNLYKSRVEIEQNFDYLKNLLEQDKIYLQNQYSVEMWGLINQIALMLIYRIHNILAEKGLTKKYSIQDFIRELKYIRKVKINGKWRTSEYTERTKELLKKVNIEIS